MDLRILNGHIGQDAQLNVINGTNRKVINFSVAISKGYKDKDGAWVNNTVWVNCSKFLGPNDSEKLVPYLTKGRAVIIQGEPDFKIWQSKKDGSFNVDQRLNISSIEFLPTKKEESSEVSHQEREAQFESEGVK